MNSFNWLDYIECLKSIHKSSPFVTTGSYWLNSYSFSFNFGSFGSFDFGSFDFSSFGNFGSLGSLNLSLIESFPAEPLDMFGFGIDLI